MITKFEGRHGGDRKSDQGENIFTLIEGGLTRRLAAVKKLGLNTIEAKVIDCDALIAEHDENEMRKSFTVSERVAIAQAVAEKLGPRQGKRTDLATSENIFLSDKGQTRDLAAAKAGLGSGMTYEAAKKVVETGAPELVTAMDEGKVKWRKTYSLFLA